MGLLWMAYLERFRQFSSANIARVHGDKRRCAFLQGHQHSISCHKGVALNGLQAAQQFKRQLMLQKSKLQTSLKQT